MCAILYSWGMSASQPRSVGVLVTLVWFFFKQKTAYDMRISDWSSDVCSSDLDEHLTWVDRFEAGWDAVKEIVGKVWYWIIAGIAAGAFIHGYEIGRATCRERVCQYV